MSQSNRSYRTEYFLRKLKKKGKKYEYFNEHIVCLQEEAVTSGLDENNIKLLAEIITNTKPTVKNCVSLLKCFIPVHKVDAEIVQNIIEWCIFSVDNIQITITNNTLQWIIGIWEYHLSDRKYINMYYDVFFYTLCKNTKLVPQLARLIYIMTKPEDVTRRQVLRLLKLQTLFPKPQRHLTALLSLFKTYKPELVPENIASVNIQSVWNPLPDILHQGFDRAKNRLSNFMNLQSDDCHLEWNIKRKRKKLNTEPLVPSVGYFHMGSNIFKEQNMTSIFDLSSMEELGKKHLKVELPARAISLLANTAGYHLLTFADRDYQFRFVYNLYNTIQKAFMLESERYSKDELTNLLSMTAEFCQYMQQGIPVIDHFLNEYLSLREGDNSIELLSLLQWSFTCTSDFQDNFFKQIRMMFEESSLEIKCQIIKTFRILLTNVYVCKGLNQTYDDKLCPFLGQIQIKDIENVVESITTFVNDLVVCGLIIHELDSLFLIEALTFYEQVCMLESHTELPIWTIAPPAVIYGSFTSSCCVILTRVCDLLLRYEEKNKTIQASLGGNIVTKETQLLQTYMNDLDSVLWSNKAFSGRKEKDRQFLKTFPNEIIKNLSPNYLDTLLNIKHHYAMLPYICTFSRNGTVVTGIHCATSVADSFFPAVSKFVQERQKQKK